VPAPDSSLDDLRQRVIAMDAILGGSTTIDRPLIHRCFAGPGGLNLSAMPQW
jgi:hypothetical protein